jgi:hypothetical protein
MNKEKVARQVYNIIQNENDSRPVETNVLIRTSPKRISLPPNLMVFQAAAYLCSTKLNASTNRILMFFFAKSAYENYIGIDIKTLMEELVMSKPTVVNALKELETNNIIIKYQNVNDNRRHDYFINPITAWKGNSYTRDRQIKKIAGINPDQLDMFPDK